MRLKELGVSGVIADAPVLLKKLSVDETWGFRESHGLIV